MKSAELEEFLRAWASELARREVCRCRGQCACGNGFPGPVAYEALRDGKRVKLCTKCIGASDEALVVLVRPGDVGFDAIAKYDAFGARLLARRAGGMRWGS